MSDGRSVGGGIEQETVYLCVMKYTPQRCDYYEPQSREDGVTPIQIHPIDCVWTRNHPLGSRGLDGLICGNVKAHGLVREVKLPVLDSIADNAERQRILEGGD